MKFCTCGQPLHYTYPAMRVAVERLIAQSGDEDVAVTNGARTWIVQRHYIALHGLKARDLPYLKFPEQLDHDRVFLPYRHDAGGNTIDAETRDYQDQMFSHHDPDDGRLRHFHIPKLKRLIAQNKLPLATFPVNLEEVDFVLANRPIDETHLAQRISDEFLNEPGIICLFPDGSQLIVDGNHRFVKRGRLGLSSMDFWLVPEEIWQKSLLNVPSAFESI
jgi:hypothetical protein